MPQLPSLKKEVLAHMELQRAGSVMARDEHPEWRKKLSPLMGTVLDVVDSMLAFGPSPLDAGGGGSKAVINIAPVKDLIPAYVMAAKEAPKVLARANKDPRVISINLYRMLYQGVYLPDIKRILINPDQTVSERAVTLVHELQHFVNEPRVAKMSSENALQSAEQIFTLLPDDPPKAALLSHLLRAREAFSVRQRLPKVLHPKIGDPIGTAEARMAYTEALSYLSENVLYGYGQPKFFRDLADSLGIGLK